MAQNPSTRAWIYFLLTVFLVGCGRSDNFKGSEKKLIILGFDGADPGLVNRWMGEGKLPHLAKLQAMGDYRELGSTIPPQSPVAWSTFATGTNPGGHGIFDFLVRSPEDYTPGVSTMSLKPPEFFLGLFPKEKAHAEPTRGGTAFWKVAADSGIRTTLLTIPYAFPPDELDEGHQLCGLGVPDLRETNSTFTYLATDLSPEELEQPTSGGRLVKVEAINGEIGAYLEAMIHPQKQERVRIPINFSIHPDHSVDIRLGDHSAILKPGQWSEWLPFRFKLTPFMKVSGICRFHLFTSSPEFRLYVTPLCIDPANPYMPISYPDTFAKELFEKVGYFKTVGWVYDTSALNEERLSDEQFVVDLKSITLDREKIFLTELEERNWDLFIGVFTATDRAAHMFWRFMDPEHPLYDPVGAATYGDVIEWTYKQMDNFVGQVMAKYVDANTTLIVMSDHGFHSFRRSFHTNTWLAQNGYLFFKGMEKLAPEQEIPRELYPQGDFFPKVVWNRTRAYALGTGQIYVNLQGREAQGVVKSAEYNSLLEELSQGLLGVRDPLNDRLILKKVYKGKEVYHGDYLDKVPDLVLGFQDGYRTSKETMLGGIPPDLVANNLGKWSGDHSASAMEETPGVIFSNRKITKDHPHLVDFAATVLDYFGVRKLPEMEGGNLFSSGSNP